MARKKSDKWEMEPQKSSAAQFITYIASTGRSKSEDWRNCADAFAQFEFLK